MHRPTRPCRRLPYLFATCRFAHFLKCIVRDKIGSFKEREDMESWLNSWISQFVTTDEKAPDKHQGAASLADASVVVEEVPGNPGYYTSTLLPPSPLPTRRVNRLPALGHETPRQQGRRELVTKLQKKSQSAPSETSCQSLARGLSANTTPNRHLTKLIIWHQTTF